MKLIISYLPHQPMRVGNIINLEIMKKNYNLKILNAKIIEFSNIVEQNLEEILNELIANNYRRFDYASDNIIKNESNKLYGEINEIALSMIALPKSKKKLFIEAVFRWDDAAGINFIPEVIRLIKFSSHLKDINNAILLIKINLNELYKYPAFKKQAYIPDFILALSSFFKENIDIFFANSGKNPETGDKTSVELKKIMSYGHKIINEFFLNIKGGNIDNVEKSENQVIYYSNIISILELISISSLEFTQI